MKANKNSKEYLIAQISGARFSLMLLILFTLVNLVLVLVNANRYFLFSASVPYYLTLFCKGMDNGFAEGSWDVNGGYTMAALIVSVVIVAVYVLVWIISRKREGWLTGALVMFLLDSIALLGITWLLYGSPLVNIIDIAFHAWALWQLFQGVRALKKLKEGPRTVEDVRPKDRKNP